jgi:hypothetical protein
MFQMLRPRCLKGGIESLIPVDRTNTDVYYLPLAVVVSGQKLLVAEVSICRDYTKNSGIYLGSNCFSTSGALTLTWENDNMDAILRSLVAWRLAVAMIAQTLFEFANNPNGKLPMTFHRNVVVRTAVLNGTYLGASPSPQTKYKSQYVVCKTVLCSRSVWVGLPRLLNILT